MGVIYNMSWYGQIWQGKWHGMFYHMVYGLTWYDIALYMTFLVLNI